MTDFPKYKHRPCPCGCGELADECMRPGSALNAFSISGDYRTEADYNLAASRAVEAEQRRAEQARPCGCYADDPDCPPEHAEFNTKGQ